MKKENIGPKIEAATKEFLADSFANANAGATFVLESFKPLYRKTLEEVVGIFESNELKLIIDIFNGHMLNASMAGQEIWWSVAEGIKYDALDVKWEISKDNILSKIENLTCYQKACLEIWANGFWYGGDPEKKQLDIEKHVGLLL